MTSSASEKDVNIQKRELQTSCSPHRHYFPKGLAREEHKALNELEDRIPDPWTSCPAILSITLLVFHYCPIGTFLVGVEARWLTLSDLHQHLAGEATNALSTKSAVRTKIAKLYVEAVLRWRRNREYRYCCVADTRWPAPGRHSAISQDQPTNLHSLESALSARDW